MHSAKLAESVGEAQFAAYRTVIERATEVIGDSIRASRWLSQRHMDFAGKSPLEAFADSGYNPTEILQILGRIEHGVYF